MIESDTNIFIKSIDPTKQKTKLLFLMGATWHTRCMFDLRADEDSFADILQKKHIETYTFDNIGIGPNECLSMIGDGHRRNVDLSIQLLVQYQIDSIIGYSYGAVILMDILDRLPDCVKNIIFLDPYPNLVHEPTELIDGGDKKIITKDYIDRLLKSHRSTLGQNIKKFYLSEFSTLDSLKVAAYPGKILQQNFHRFCSKENIKKLNSLGARIIFTSTARQEIIDLFPSDRCTKFDDASHWILIEPARYRLADYVEKIITEKSNRS